MQLVYRVDLGNANHVHDASFAVGKPEYGKNQTKKTASEQALNKAGSQGNLTSPNSISNLGSKSSLKTSAANVATQSHGANLAAELVAAIKDVRNDHSQTTWYLLLI